MTIIKALPIVFSGKNVLAIQALLKTETRRVVTPQPWRADVLGTPNAWVWSSQKRAIGLTYAEMAEKGYHRMAWAADVKNPAFLEGCSPYTPGDRLWVKETWRIAKLLGDDAPMIQYRADGAELEAISIDRMWGEDKYLDWYQRQCEHVATDCARAGIDADLDGIFRWTKEINPNRWRSPRFMPRWASRLTLEIESRWAEQLQHITARNCFAEGIRGLLPPFDEEDRIDTERIISNFAGILRWGFMVSWDALNAKRGFGWYTNPWVLAITFRHLVI